MKRLKAYRRKDMSRLSVICLAAMFFLGAQPVSAQEETEVEEIIDSVVAAPRVVRPVNKYPTYDVSGKVVDASTHQPLAGVKLQAYNNELYAAMTDEDGTFTISVPKFVTSLTAVLEGYDMTQVALNGRSENIDIKLYSDSYAPLYKTKTVPTNYNEAKNFETSTAMSVDQEIQQRMAADVHTISRSAIPGMGVQMFMNGITSLNANAQPLIVIDGVIQDVMYEREMVHSGYFENALASISLDDIEDVKVLKNGTAIYGAKGANGVILINTKRNKSMATRIDANLSVGVELLPKLPDVMNASQYRSYASEMLGSTTTKLSEFKFLETDPNYYYYNMYHNNTDWSDVVYKEALTQNYSIHVQGGDDVANYNLSVGYVSSDATLKKNNFNRFNIRFNTDILLNKWITTRFDASFSNTNRNLRDDGFNEDYATSTVTSPSFLALVKAPFLSPYAFSTDGKVSDYVADADDYLDEVLGSTASLANPEAILLNGEAKNKNNMNNNMINIAVTPKWQPTRNFSLQERFAYTLNNFNESYYLPLTGMPDYYVQDLGVVQNVKKSLYSKHNAIFSDTRFDWALPMGAHRLDIFGGIRYMNDTYSASNLVGYNTGNDKTPNSTTSLAYKTTVGTEDEWSSLAYYANVDYNYKEKYYLQGSMAMETSSRFGKDAKSGLKLFGVAWGLFPSINGAWVVSNEDWFHPNKLVNMLKVNAGYELNGNDGIDKNATYTYMSGKLMLRSVTGIGITNIGNTELQWETTRRFNAGLDMNLLDNRLNVKFNYFFSKTSNMLTLGTIAYVAGINDYWTNDGAMKNQGFDLSLSSRLYNANNFKVEAGASVGHYKNELTKLPGGANEFTTSLYNANILSRVGCPVGLFYGYRTNGVYATTAAAKSDGYYVVGSTGTKDYFGAGDMIFEDLNGDKEINESDMTIIGDPNPDIYGNIFANFFIGKRWSVNCNFTYSLGNDVYNYQRSVLEAGSMFMNQTTALTNRWIVEGQVTDIPKITYGDPMGNSRFSDRWIEDGSFLKLKNITVSYKFPIRSEFIQGLTLWAAGNNLLTFSKYLGSDPEVSAGTGVLYQGIDRGNLAYGRSFTLGVKINL